MHVVKFTVEIHRSLRDENDPKEYVIEVNEPDKTIGELIWIALEGRDDIRATCLNGKKAKPGILYISGNHELRSLGIMDEIFIPDEDFKVKIVPVLHGG